MGPVQESLSDKLIVVTGGFGAAGGATAAAARQHGARVAVIDFGDPPPGLSYDHVEARVDLADFEQAQAAVTAITARLGEIDGLINVAGGFDMQALETGAELWVRLFRINALTAINTCRAAIDYLRSPGGAIVNVAAAAAGRAAGGMGPYAASKATVLRLTESLAEELKGRGVRVNAISPTTLDTPANRAAMPKADAAKWVRLDEFAQLALFLASDAASGVTGADVRLAGRT
jgi:NAD(P)-dependent dehydrogenase (short-subunit alcohol dehydrogenase family)